MHGSRHLFSVADRSLEQLTEFVESPSPRSRPPLADAVVAVDLKMELPHLQIIVAEGVQRSGASVAARPLGDQWWLHPDRLVRDAETRHLVAVVEAMHDDRELRLQADRLPVPVLGAASGSDQALEVIADLLVLHDLLGSLRNRSMVLTDGRRGYVRSWVQACVRIGIDLTVLRDAANMCDHDEFQHETRYAALFGSSLQLSTDRTEALRRADIVAGEHRLPTGAGFEHRVVLPLMLSGEEAELGIACAEGPRTLLYHRVERSKDVVAAFVSGTL